MMDVALPISHSEAKNEVKISFFIIAENKPFTAQKKIIKELIFIHESPALFIDVVKLKLCLEIYATFVRVTFFGRNIIPTIKADNITVKYNIIPSNMFP